MAIFSKKLRIKNSAGATQVVNIYSTTGESGSNYMRATVDGQAGYISLGSTTDANRTSGRVKKTNGVTYAILTSSVPPYGYSLLISNGSFTVPSGVTKLRVTCVGGGAGALAYPGSPDGNESEALVDLFGEGTTTVYSGGGGQTSFSSIIANGAGGNSVQVRTWSRNDGEYIHHYANWINGTIGNGSIRGGHYQSFGYHGGTPGVVIKNIKGQVVHTAGTGGGGGGDGHQDTIYTITGSSGYSNINTLSVTSGQVIPYTIGTGGANYNLWSYASENGGAGAILVEWGLGIQ